MCLGQKRSQSQRSQRLPNIETLEDLSKKYWPEIKTKEEYSAHIDAFAKLSLEEMIHRIKVMPILTEKSVRALDGNMLSENQFVQTLQRNIPKVKIIIADTENNNVRSLRKSLDGLKQLPQYQSSTALSIIYLKMSTTDGFSPQEAAFALRSKSLDLLRDEIYKRIGELEEKNSDPEPPVSRLPIPKDKKK